MIGTCCIQDRVVVCSGKVDGESRGASGVAAGLRLSQRGSEASKRPGFNHVCKCARCLI